MPKSMTENAFLSSINNNLTRRGDAVHADLWIGKKFTQQLSLKINKKTPKNETAYIHILFFQTYFVQMHFIKLTLNLPRLIYFRRKASGRGK